MKAAIILLSAVALSACGQNEQQRQAELESRVSSLVIYQPNVYSASPRTITRWVREVRGAICGEVSYYVKDPNELSGVSTGFRKFYALPTYSTEGSGMKMVFPSVDEYNQRCF